MRGKYFLSAIMLTTAALLSSCSDDGKALSDSFVIEGQLPLPDGYVAGICVHTDTAYSVSLGDDTIRNGHFRIEGKLDKPYQGTLMTNNLALVEKNQWPTDSIHWTYTDVFVSNGQLLFTGADEQSFRLTGTQVQADYNEWLDMGGDNQGDPWTFINTHPSSVISTWLACQLTERAYRLTAEQVNQLAQTVKGSPVDTARFALLQQKLEAARATVKDAPLVDLQLIDVKGDTCQLVNILPQNGKLVLIDFWASWCGICLYSMPDIARLAAQYADRFCVVAVSIDTKEEAWRKAMEQHPEPWPQYMTTAQGYQGLFDKYQVGNGVPYYLLVSADGHVLCSPASPEELAEILENEKQ